MSNDEKDKFADLFAAPSGPDGNAQNGAPDGLPGGMASGMDAAQLNTVVNALNEEPNVVDNESQIDKYVEVTSESYSGSGLGFHVKDEDVLCTTCKHAWLVRKHAQVMNLDVNGKPFMAREGYCMASPTTLFSLGDRFVLECNLYEKGGKPRVTIDDIRKDSENGNSE